MNKSTGDLLTVDEKFKCPELKEYISKDRCINICTARMQNTKCAGHKCECPWRLCIRCVYENEITHFREYPDDIERCRVIDLKKGLCEDHANGNDHNGRRKIIKLAEADDFSAPPKNGKGGKLSKFTKLPHSERIKATKKALEKHPDNKTSAADELGTNLPMLLECERLFNLSEELVALLDSKTISATVAKKAALLSPEIQISLAKRLKENTGLGKKEISLIVDEVSKRTNGKEKRRPYKKSGSAKTAKIKDKFSGTPVALGGSGASKITASDEMFLSEVNIQPLAVSLELLEEFMRRKDFKAIAIKMAEMEVVFIPKTYVSM